MAQKRSIIDELALKGWNLKIEIEHEDTGIIYDCWGYGHPEDSIMALSGKGKSWEEMLENLQKWEQDFYPHLTKEPALIARN